MQEPTRDDNSGSNRAIKRGILPFDDLVCLDPKMSEARRSQRLATDFSIARILAADEPCSSSGSSRSSSSFPEDNRLQKSTIISCPCCPNVPISTQEITSSLPIVENRKELINTSKRIDIQLQDNRCIVTTDPIVETPAKNPTLSVSHDDTKQGNDLPWLHCTRYRPPRLPKRSSAGKISKRRPGKHPRIPFTAFQLQILEDKYSKGAYLARRDVVQLSLILRLPQSRVKIWFQNRRARERRESLQSGKEAARSNKDVDNS